ncbi:MAG: hypothetical protein IJ173_00455 [Kiritimatiellae bacterium]|nr:hypothetical protein [Kiritimatiellia bacterium]
MTTEEATEVLKKKVLCFLPPLSLKTATLLVMAACAIAVIVGVINLLYLCFAYGLDVLNVAGSLVGIMHTVALLVFFAVLLRNQK